MLLASRTSLNGTAHQSMTRGATHSESRLNAAGLAR